MAVEQQDSEKLMDHGIAWNNEGRGPLEQG